MQNEIRIWTIELSQKRHNLLDGHQEAIYGFFSSREEAARAREVLTRKKGKKPGKFHVTCIDIDEPYNVGGFHEYLW